MKVNKKEEALEFNSFVVWVSPLYLTLMIGILELVRLENYERTILGLSGMCTGLGCIRLLKSNHILVRKVGLYKLWGYLCIEVSFILQRLNIGKVF